MLFYVGVVFAYFFVFPVMFQFFAATTPRGVTMMTDINAYLDFVITMFLAFGAAFEVPVAVVLLVLTGVVRLEKLKENRRFVLIGIFIIAALLTPPDVVSQSIMAVPMYLLYEGGIVMARILSKMRREASDSEEVEASPPLAAKSQPCSGSSAAGYPSVPLLQHNKATTDSDE